MRKPVGILYMILFLFLISCGTETVAAQQMDQNDVLLFCYFKGNGEDGLHLAYSMDGYTWIALNRDHSFLTPEAGHDKLMRDPCIIKGPDGLFHMVWTDSWHDHSIGYASSPDLIHWSVQQAVPVMEHEPKARNCWAPEIIYDHKNHDYMIFWATTIPGRFPDTDSTGDDGYNHRIYYTITKDFHHYSKTKLLFNPGFDVIDATIDHDGKQNVMFFKDERLHPTKKNIRMAFSKNLTGPYTKITKPITGRYWAEGPTALNLGRTWIVYFDKYRDHTMGAVRSTDLKHWTDISGKVRFPDGTRHGTVFRVSRSEFQKLKEVK